MLVWFSRVTLKLRVPREPGIAIMVCFDNGTTASLADAGCGCGSREGEEGGGGGGGGESVMILIRVKLEMITTANQHTGAYGGWIDGRLSHCSAPAVDFTVIASVLTPQWVLTGRHRCVQGHREPDTAVRGGGGGGGFRCPTECNTATMGSCWGVHLENGRSGIASPRPPSAGKSRVRYICWCSSGGPSRFLALESQG